MSCILVDISVNSSIYADPKERKRQRDRERYAKNRELKKQATTSVNDDNTICQTPATGQSGITQQQYRTAEQGDVF